MQTAIFILFVFVAGRDVAWEREGTFSMEEEQDL